MISTASSNIKGSYRFSIAPMMDCTDRHFRVLMRQISQRCLLYSEMIVAQAIHHSQNRNKLLDFDNIEHPISIQLGGDNPQLLAEASKISEDWGYDEINFNIGCPSPKVKSGNFGASLMAQPDLVASCIEAMTQATNLPVTVKHRIGIDDLDDDKYLSNFVERMASAGAKRFAIHARKALLEGLSPKENRTIPPLQYERVARLKDEKPHLKIELNGGLQNIRDCLNALNKFDGVMVGRSAYYHPLAWNSIDEKIFGEKKKILKPSNIIFQVLPFVEKHLENGGNIWDMGKHIVHIVEGVPGAKKWRSNFCSLAQRNDSNISILKNSALQLKAEGL